MTQVQTREVPVAGGMPAFLSLEQLLQVPVPIAYFAGIFPARSETFVYREVQALRLRGWNVIPVALNDRVEADSTDLDILKKGRLVVYGKQATKTVQYFLKELVDHPIQSLRTFITVGIDVASPREHMNWKARVKLIGQAFAGIGIAGRLRGVGTRHIHCHFAHAPTTVGMYAATQLKVPFSFTGHANDLFQRRVLLRRKLERASFVACISRWHRELYRSILPADESVYPIVRCGVDVQSWHVEPMDESTSTIRLLSVCRLVQKKGIDTLLQALAMYTQKSSRDWKLTIAGDGPEDERLRAMARELGISDRVDFLGPVNNDRVRELLHSTDMFVLPCRTDDSGDRDGIPVVLMEAMASGVPVIAGDLPAIRELVEVDVTGLLPSGGNAVELCEAISRLAENDLLRFHLAKSGRERVEKEFALDANISRLEDLLDESIRQSNRNTTHMNRMPVVDAEVTTSASGSTSRRSRKYALITPCRDEAKYARRTLDSITKQSIPPAVWIIVDDGSKDETPSILKEYAEKFPYIKVITRGDRGDRKLGGGVIDAFYTGYDTIDPDDYEYVCKLDLDLDIPPQYFESLMLRMEQNPRIGTCSGKPYFTREGRQISEKCGDENSVGMIKFYRTTCFKQIGGFVRELMWDGIDCHRCRLLGWIAVSWDDPLINFEHLRAMGTSHKNWWTGRVRHGVGQYFMGTGLAYMTASAVFRMSRPPIVMGGLAMLWGYIRSALQRKPRYGDAQFRKFLRRYQWNCLFQGKRKATELLNRQQSEIWARNTASNYTK